MKIPKYWARGEFTDTNANGKEFSFTACGWSFDSEEDAKIKANERARSALLHFFEVPAIRTNWLNKSSQNQYQGYAFWPLQEEVIDTIDGSSDDNEPIAAVTCNRYGSLVLNTDAVLFADIDLATDSFQYPVINKVQYRGFFDALMCSFSPKRYAERFDEAIQRCVEQIREWLWANSSSCRIYRTHSGLRLLFTDRLYDPKSDLVKQLFADLDVDPLYCRLTDRQNCFRARLTPKVWRCGCPRPPRRFPWHNSEEEKIFRGWFEKYMDISRAYTVCRLLDSGGSLNFRNEVHPDIERIIALHDQYTCTGDELPLA